MTYKSSYSQHSVFDNCEFYWYLQRVRNIPYKSDMCYADGGNAIHYTLEKYYSGKFSNLDETRKYFDIQWELFKLHEHDLFNTKNSEYWDMVINGIKLAIRVTIAELKINFDDCRGMIDIVDKDAITIGDWKSSRRTPEKDEEYRQQGMLYAWLYKRKFGMIPKEVTFYYLRYKGKRCFFKFSPTEEDVKNIEIWYNNILVKMTKILNKTIKPKRCDECYKYCPYINVCQNIDRKGDIFTIFSLGHYIRLTGPIPKQMYKVLDKKFSFELKNSYWIKKNKPGFDGIIHLWNDKTQLLPIGFKHELIKTINDFGKHFKRDIIIQDIDKRQFNNEKIVMPDNLLNGKILRPYQEQAVTTLLNKKVGTLELGTGAGKTLIAIDIMRRLNVKTLFLVDKVELLRQTKKRIEEGLGIEVGQLGAGVKDLTKFITVATIQTISKNLKDYINFLRTIRLVMFDEAHKSAAKTFNNVSKELLNTEYRVGLTGTAFRDSGDTLNFFAVAGSKIFELKSQTLIDDGWLVRPTIQFYKKYMPKEQVKILIQKTKTGKINEIDNYAKFYEELIYLNEWRNQAIVDIVKKHKGKKILILTKLVNHGVILTELLHGQHLYGGTSKKVREQMFNDFVNGDNNVLVSTLSIFAEGIDIPILHGVINASANVGDVKTIQILGRVLRKLDGKENAFYIDFIDESRFFSKASFKRRRSFIKEGHDVKIIDFEKRTERKKSILD